MKFHLYANDVIKKSELQKYNTVILHFIGGSYGNYLYRIIHKYLFGLPTINDNFTYYKGNSHSVTNDQYTDDILSFMKKQDIVINKEIEFDWLLIKKHEHPKLSYKSCWLKPLVAHNIKISLENKSFYVWAMIQNMIKSKDITNFTKNNHFELDWIINNNFDHYANIEKIFTSMVKDLNNSWINNLQEQNTYTIPMSDILIADNLYNHLEKLSVLLKISLNKTYVDFVADHQIFLDNQLYIDSYIRHNNKSWDSQNLLDCLLHKFE